MLEGLVDAVSRFKAAGQIIAVMRSDAFAERDEHVIRLDNEAGVSKGFQLRDEFGFVCCVLGEPLVFLAVMMVTRPIAVRIERMADGNSGIAALPVMRIVCRLWL